MACKEVPPSTTCSLAGKVRRRGHAGWFRNSARQEHSFEQDCVGSSTRREESRPGLACVRSASEPGSERLLDAGDRTSGVDQNKHLSALSKPRTTR